jgi:hypothetical protein
MVSLSPISPVKIVSTIRALSAGLAMALLSVSAAAQSGDPDLAQVEALPQRIATVYSGGAWQQGGQEGFYRAVVTGGGIEHISNRLYVQWLALDFETNGYRLMRTVAIDEVNNSQAAIGIEPDLYDPDEPHIKVNVTYRDNTERSFRLVLMPDGEYQLK